MQSNVRLINTLFVNFIYLDWLGLGFELFKVFFCNITES